jgi:hypothetical protein
MASTTPVTESVLPVETSRVSRKSVSMRTKERFLGVMAFPR